MSQRPRFKRSCSSGTVPDREGDCLYEPKVPLQARLQFRGRPLLPGDNDMAATLERDLARDARPNDMNGMSGRSATTTDSWAARLTPADVGRFRRPIRDR